MSQQVNAILGKIEKLNPELLYGGKGLLEEVESYGKVTVNNKDVMLETSEQYNNLQVVLKGEQTAYCGVKAVKKGDSYVQPKSKSYEIVLMRVRNYGEKTAAWLQEQGINLDYFQPGKQMLKAVAQ